MKNHLKMTEVGSRLRQVRHLERRRKASDSLRELSPFSFMEAGDGGINSHNEEHTED